jgi:signal transduction histidine kinase
VARDQDLTPYAPGDQLAALCRFVLNARLVVVFVTILTAGRGLLSGPWLPGAILATALMSLVPLWFWHTVGSTLVRHPAFLALDVVVTAVLIAVTGAQGPLLFYALTTAALAGLLGSRNATVVAALVLVVVHAAATPVGVQGVLLAAVQDLLGLPTLHAMVAAGMAAVRLLLTRYAQTEEALTRAVQHATAARERARLAREMHDSLTKTLQGLALSATAVERAAERGSDRTIALARSLTRAARTAASEARDLISDLRTDRLEGPLESSAHAHVAAWSAASGVPASFAGEGGTDQLSAESRYELLAILKEALRNVERHAGAGGVAVTLRGGQRAVWLMVTDDGCGFTPPPTLEELAAAGHYGLVGMAERAERVGGYLDVTAGPGRGTTVCAVVPYAAEDEQAATLREAG